MELRQRTRGFCLWVMVCAVLLRLTAAGVPGKILRWLVQPERVPLLIYLETGRDVRFSASLEEVREKESHVRESPAPVLPETRPVFEAAAAEAVEMYYDCTLRPELGPLVEKSLAWDLTGEEARVLILHTHATESYAEEEGYRSQEETKNMLSIGDAVAKRLEEAGIGVVHDRQLHDHPSYNGSYVSARKAIQSCLEEYPGIELVLDLHRDASAGAQQRTVVQAEGADCARLMLVVGTNAAGQDHEHWQENLALGLKLHLILEEQTPGIMRPLQLRRQRFNQDLSPGALIVEVGTAGNSHAEAMLAAEKLARAVIGLAKGTG